MKKQVMKFTMLMVFILNVDAPYALARMSDCGTCCPEQGSDCVIGTVIIYNKYLKPAGGSCNP
jgi:hypothetical protein